MLASHGQQPMDGALDLPGVLRLGQRPLAREAELRCSEGSEGREPADVGAATGGDPPGALREEVVEGVGRGGDGGNCWW